MTMFRGSGANMKCFLTVSLNPDGYGVTSNLPNLSYGPAPCFAGAVALGANRDGRHGPVYVTMFRRSVSKSASTTALAMKRDA